MGRNLPPRSFGGRCGSAISRGVDTAPTSGSNRRLSGFPADSQPPAPDSRFSARTQTPAHRTLNPTYRTECPPPRTECPPRRIECPTPRIECPTRPIESPAPRIESLSHRLRLSTADAHSRARICHFRRGGCSTTALFGFRTSAQFLSPLSSTATYPAR